MEWLLKPIARQVEIIAMCNSAEQGINKLSIHAGKPTWFFWYRNAEDERVWYAGTIDKLFDV